MSEYPIPKNEPERLCALRDLKIVRSGPSPDFDAITELASDILGCPIALISLVDEAEQWFKAKIGIDVQSTSREVAFCAHTIANNAPLVIPDARLDQRFQFNPLVLGDPNIVFYAGVPISLDNEHNLGTLCIIDTKPRNLSDTEYSQLLRLARITESLITAFREQQATKIARAAERRKSGALQRTVSLLEQVKQLSGVGGWELQLDPLALTWTDETKRIHEVPIDYEPQLDTAIDFYAPEARDVIRACVKNAMEDGTPWDVELPLITAKNRKIWVRAMGRPVYQNGSLVSLIGAFQDITETTEAHARVVASEKVARLRSEQLQTVIGNMEEGVSVFDENCKLTMWNQRYIDIFRKPEGEVRPGVSLKDLLSREKERGEFDDDIELHLNELMAGLEDGSSQTFLFRTKLGTIIQSTHAPLPGGGWVGTHSDVTARVTAAEQDEYAARHDALTGLANRLEFNRRFEAASEKTSDGRVSILLMVDLDHFKEINDTYGHQAGDDLLVEVARRLKGCVRESDLVARLGGDEFAVLTSFTHADTRSNVTAIAERINQSISLPFAIADIEIRIGASVGICVADGPRFRPDELIARADRALYKVKASCRGGYYFHDDVLVAEEFAERRKAAAVRRAVPNSSLALAFQPIYDLRRFECCGAEALIRWAAGQPQLSASELIGFAEQTGAIGEISAWVLNESLRNAKTWPDELSVSVNVSPSQLGKGVFRDQVSSALAHHQFQPGRLEIEITEQVLLDDKAAIIDELLEIQAAGVRVVLDDFGTGYSSLSYLQRFPFDKLKIDRSFVSEHSQKAQSRAIVSSMYTLTRELGISCTVEGVECQERLDEIIALGCDYAQGYFLSRPIPAEEFHTTTDLQLGVA